MTNIFYHIFRAGAVATAALAFSLSVSAQQGSDGTHRFASYNVRYVHPKNGDVGERAWSDRGPYVVKLIKDYDFDIVGMQEVTGRNGGISVNPATGRSQLEDLKAWLPDYTFSAYERYGEELAKDYSHNAIAFKTNKYELLDRGCFWVRPDYSTPGPGWDSDGIWRTVGWNKLKVRDTGEIFYFCVTHVNYGPTMDGLNGGKVITKAIAEIAGDAPVVLVGDFNMRRMDHINAYRNYITYFQDASLTTPVNVCLPESNGQTAITAQGWKLLGSDDFAGSEYDYVFYRNITPLERHVITENYGRSVNPSDHFPTLVIARLGKK